MQCERCLEVKPLINLRCVHSICPDCDTYLRTFAEEKNKACLIKDYCSGGFLLRKNETESDALERLRRRRSKIHSTLNVKMHDLKRKSKKGKYGIEARMKYLRDLFEKRHDMKIGPTVILIGYSYEMNKFRYALIHDEVTYFPRRDLICIDVYFGIKKEYTVRLTTRNGISPEIIVGSSCSDLYVFNEPVPYIRGKMCTIISTGGTITIEDRTKVYGALHDYDYRATYYADGEKFVHDMVHFNIYEKDQDLDFIQRLEHREYDERYYRMRKYEDMIKDMAKMRLEEDKTRLYIKWDKKFCVELKNLDSDIEILEIRSKLDPVNLRTLPTEE